MIAIRLIRPALLVTALFVPFTGGAQVAQKEGKPDRSANSEAPFIIPDTLPKPPDAKKISLQKSAKGGNVSYAFETSWSLTRLYEFYQRELEKSGLKPFPGYAGLDEEINHAMNLGYIGWPGGKNLYINASDMGFTTERDVRMVSITVQ